MRLVSRVNVGLGGLVSLAVTAALVALPQTAGAAAAAKRPDKSRHVTSVKVYEKHPFFTHEHGIDHPAAATYVDGRGVLAIARTTASGTEVSLLDPRSDTMAGQMTVPQLTDPETLADDGQGDLAALTGRAFLAWSASSRGTATVASRLVTGATIKDARGMAYDPAGRRWLVLDGARQRIVFLRALGATMRASDGPSLARLGSGDLRGVALDVTGQRIYVGDQERSRIYALTRGGHQRGVLDVSDVNATSLRSLAFGPTADPTDATNLKRDCPSSGSRRPAACGRNRPRPDSAS